MPRLGRVHPSRRRPPMARLNTSRLRPKFSFGRSRMAAWFHNQPSEDAENAPVNTTAPVISGVQTVGSLMTCVPGTWAGTPAPAFTFQWTRDGTPIALATANTYTTVVGDAATTLACEVTGTNSLGSSMAVSNGLAIT